MTIPRSIGFSLSFDLGSCARVAYAQSCKRTARGPNGLRIEVLSTREILPGLARLRQHARISARPYGIVLHCRDAAEAVTLLHFSVRPDFLLVNPEVPWRGETKLLHEIREARLPTQVAFMVPDLNSPRAIEVARLGPAALISKDLSARRLVGALERGFPAAAEERGDTGSDAGNAVLDDEPIAEAWARGVPLTRREIQVAGLAGKGLHSREIAEALYVTEGTVKGHLHEIYGRLKIRGRTDLTRYCLGRGWI